MTRGRSPPTPQQQELETLSDVNVITFYAEELRQLHVTGRVPEAIPRSAVKALARRGILTHRLRDGKGTRWSLTPKALTMLLNTEYP